MIKKVLLALKNAYVYLAANPLPHIGLLLLLIVLGFAKYKLHKILVHLRLEYATVTVASILLTSLGAVLWLSAQFTYAQLLDRLEDPALLAAEAKKIGFKDLVFVNFGKALEAFVGYVMVLAVLFALFVGLEMVLLGLSDPMVALNELLWTLRLGVGGMPVALQIAFLVVAAMGLGVYGRILRAKEMGDAFFSAWLIFSPSYWVRVFKIEYFLLVFGWLAVVVLFGVAFTFVSAFLTQMVAKMAYSGSTAVAAMFLGIFLLSPLYLVYLYYMAHFSVGVALEADTVVRGRGEKETVSND